VSKKLILVVCLLSFAAGWSASSAVPRTKDRPFLTALAKIAKAALWLAAFAEPPPEEEPLQSVLVDERGYVKVNHARGW
jgi:hypothetical protein